MMATWKLAPVLATGCTTVLKPAENTPLSALKLGEIIVECGAPEGVVNIVTGFGPEAGEPLAAHKDVSKLAFTGSIATGKKLNIVATETLKRVTLELGGKSPHIIFDDCNLDQASVQAAIGCYFNSGQICIAGSRVFVQEGIYDKFLDKLAAFVKSLMVGDAFDEGSFIGPMVS